MEPKDQSKARLKDANHGKRVSATTKAPKAAKDNKDTGGTVKEKKKRAAWSSLSNQERLKRVGTIGFFVLTGISALIVLLFIAWNLFTKEPEIPTTPTLDGTEDSVNGESPTGSVSSNNLAVGDRKENYWTFLLVGRDTYGGGLTDTLMVISYDIDNQDLNVMSIPRDTIVNVPWDVKKINSVYNYATYYDQEGIDMLKDEVSALVGFQIDFTVTVEWEAVGQLVDALDGVYFDVPQDMYYIDPTQNLVIDLDAGYQLLDGDMAMQLVRYRSQSDVYGNIIGGYANGDLGRIETQQEFLTAALQQCLSIESSTRINELAQVFFNNVTTELSINNLAWFAQEAVFGGLTMSHVEFITMPYEEAYVYSRTYNNYQSYVAPVADELLALINESFNPYTHDIELENLDLIVVDSSGKISATSGYLEDTQANSYSYVPSTSSNSSSSSSSTTTDSEEEDVQEDSGTENSTQTDLDSTLDLDEGEPEENTSTVEPTATPTPTAMPVPTTTPEPTATPTPTATPEPEPTATPEPTPEPTATPEPTTDTSTGPGMVPEEE